MVSWWDICPFKRKKMFTALYSVFKKIRTNKAYTVCTWKSYIASSTYRLVSYLLADRPFPHSCKQRDQLEAWVDQTQWFVWNSPPEPCPHFFTKKKNKTRNKNHGRNKIMALEVGIVSHYYIYILFILVNCNFTDFMLLFRCSVCSALSFFSL